MKCKWSRQDWFSFVQDDKEQRIQKQMELHLTHCSICLEIYADVLTDSYVALEQKFGPAPDLTQQIMASILPSESVASGIHNENKAQKHEQSIVQQRRIQQLNHVRNPISTRLQTHVQKRAQVRSSKAVFLHYGIAASLALLLLQSGLFDQIFTYADHSEMVAKQSTEWLEVARKSTEQWITNLNHIFR